MKNCVLQENYYLPDGRKRRLRAFVEHYNKRHYHESWSTLIPADVYNGRGAKILKMLEEIKKQTFRKRRLQHETAAG